MPVATVREIWSGRDGDADLKGINRYTRIWRVTTTLASDNAVVVGGAAGLPTYGSTYPGDARAYLQRLTPRNESFSPKVWLVTAEYSNQKETAADPTTEPAIITWDTEQFQRPAVQDRNGNAILNSAGDFFDDPPQRDDSRRTCTIQKNLAAAPSWLLTYADAVNNAPFALDGLTIATGAAKVQKVSLGRTESRGGIAFRQVSLTMHFQTGLWTFVILDQGYNQICVDTSDNTKIGRCKMHTDRGEETTKPLLLDGTGYKLKNIYDPILNPSGNLPKYRSYDVYTAKDFSVLPLT